MDKTSKIIIKICIFSMVLSISALILFAMFDYADKKAIPFLSIVGGNEVADGVINIKNLSTGSQQSFAKDDVNAMIDFLS